MMDYKTRRVTRFLNRFLLQVINSLLLTVKRDSLIDMCRLYDNGWPNPMTLWFHTASSLPNPMTMTHSLTPLNEPTCLFRIYLMWGTSESAYVSIRQHTSEYRPMASDRNRVVSSSPNRSPSLSHTPTYQKKKIEFIHIYYVYNIYIYYIYIYIVYYIHVYVVYYIYINTFMYICKETDSSF